jgi:hypothetical protein
VTAQDPPFPFTRARIAHEAESLALNLWQSQPIARQTRQGLPKASEDTERQRSPAATLDVLSPIDEHNG